MRGRCLSLWALLLFIISAPLAEADSTARFNQDIRPILSNNCFQCHGPDAADRQADLRLDVPGGVDLDELMQRITSTDPTIRMPPPESHKELKPEQIETLKRWIADGAAYEQHWSFVPLQEVAIPVVQDSSWSQHPIDHFVLARLEELGKQPNVRADERSLVRRVTLDLTGLPPTPQEMAEFLADGAEHRYQRLVDRLLDTPQYGEHMARYWLDLVRFADSNGLHHDHYREMTPYRDWVIRAFNANYPFDQFVIDQIAGDLVQNPSVDQQIASGFNRLHLIIDEGTALPEESFVRNVVDRVTAVGTAFLGLTVQCAVCHDHKYDPLTQKEFYQLYAFFNNFDGAAETGHRSGTDFERGLQPPYIEFPSAQQRAELAALDSEIEALRTEIAQLNGNERENEDELPSSPLELDDKLKAAEAERRALVLSIPATLVMKEREEVRPAHVLIRGVYDQPGERVTRGTPAFLPPLASKNGPQTRLDLAKWLTGDSHPLAARVAVNRLWQQFFGVGLVRTAEDFGAQGEPPSHPELLDHLAWRFIDSSWDVKALVRSVVLSETYCQSSSAPSELFVNDPDNRQLARGSRFRLDAEVIRDQVLSVTGLLNRQQFGRSVKPPQPPGLWKMVTMPSAYPQEYEPDAGPSAFRRSIYTYWRRSIPPPQMTIFDAPTRESCTARRERTNTPLQALLLMNEQQYFNAAMHYARVLLRSERVGDVRLLRQAYERITSQLPDEATMRQLTDALNQFRTIYKNGSDSTASMLAAAEPHSADTTAAPSELAAWTMLVHSLLNLDITKSHQ